MQIVLYYHHGHGLAYLQQRIYLLKSCLERSMIILEQPLYKLFVI
jgi:hypothetical protein